MAPYFTTPTHDIDAVTAVYGPISDRLLGQVLYGLSTSNGMIGLIVAMVGGVLSTVLAMLLGLEGASIWIGVAGGLIVLAALFAFTGLTILREQARFTVLFPTPSTEPATDHQAVGELP